MSTLAVGHGRTVWSTLVFKAMRLQNVVGLWQHRRRVRNELMNLSDYQLNDVGLTRAEVLAIADKPFWRA